jgi:hypothetical protein
MAQAREVRRWIGLRASNRSRSFSGTFSSLYSHRLRVPFSVSSPALEAPYVCLPWKGEGARVAGDQMLVSPRPRGQRSPR